MFTGLVAGTGKLARPRPRAQGLRIAVQHTLQGGPILPGESIAADGCCLTAVELGQGWFDADLSPETLDRSGGRARWKAGRVVNLERALQVGDRLGGHLVQGHVDGLCKLLRLDKQADGSARLRFEIPEAGQGLLVTKGSVGLDGVSLTVARRGGDWFEVAVIPLTLRECTLGLRKPGDRLLIEYDVLGKYAVQAIKGWQGD